MVDKIVVQYGDHSLKGQTDRSLWQPHSYPNPSFDKLPIMLLGSGSIEDIPLAGVKAIFFVKSFDGRSHEDLRFHDGLPHSECLWVRITFQDEEVIEGLVRNSCDFVLQDGFFLSPIDPEGNNWLVYTLKSQLRDFHVLGLRPAPKNLPDLSHPAGRKPA